MNQGWNWKIFLFVKLGFPINIERGNANTKIIFSGSQLPCQSINFIFETRGENSLLFFNFHQSYSISVDGIKKDVNSKNNSLIYCLWFLILLPIVGKDLWL